MSQLPKGTLAARNFLESVTIKGAMASLIAWAPPLGWPIIRDILQAILEHELLDPTFDEATAIAIAVKYVLDRQPFQADFIKLKMMEHAPAAEQETALEDAEKSMARYIRRGPIQ